jgi:hypothetical protein
VCLFDSHPELLTYPCDSGFFYKVFRVQRPNLFDVDAAERFQEEEPRRLLQSLLDRAGLVGQFQQLFSAG